MECNEGNLWQFEEKHFDELEKFLIFTARCLAYVPVAYNMRLPKFPQVSLDPLRIKLEDSYCNLKLKLNLKVKLSIEATWMI